ncbi:MAG: GEVED domain-containing protein [bacterium]|nr:GEVED domain-containing protein [bacterium]
MTLRVATNANGEAPFRVNVPDLAAGLCVSATAAEAGSGDTSEFSLCAIPEEPPIAGVDFGDAPALYPTRLEDDGTRHLNTDGPRLGPLIDGELDGQPTDAANGDDTHNLNDEDGVGLPALIYAGDTATSLTFTVTANCLLDAWIDFNRDSDWDDPNEHYFVSRPLNPGANALTMVIPGDTRGGITMARFRVSTAGGLDPTGPALDGEVEDCAVRLVARNAVAHIWTFYP